MSQLTRYKTANINVAHSELSNGKSLLGPSPELSFTGIACVGKIGPNLVTAEFAAVERYQPNLQRP